MTVQTIKLAGKQFIILAKDDFLALKKRAKANYRLRSNSSAQDIADIELAQQRLNDRNVKPIPYEQARKQIGLA